MNRLAASGQRLASHMASHLASLLAILMTACLLLTLPACSRQNQATPASFVGKWKSSKLTTPLYMYDNGEWEIKDDEGGILQYGVWQYQDGKIIWSIKLNGRISHETDSVLSVTPNEFQLRESSGVTAFSRLD